MNLTEVFHQEGKKLRVEILLDETIGFKEKWTGAPVVTLEFSNLEKGKVQVKGQGKAEFLLSCDRCLSSITKEIILDFERELFSPEISIDEDTKEEQYYLDGYELDEKLLLCEVLHMCWPTKILCKETCKGICKKCGQDLNQRSCSCDDFVPDVRFANLMDIFNNSQ